MKFLNCNCTGYKYFIGSSTVYLDLLCFDLPVKKKKKNKKKLLLLVNILYEMLMLLWNVTHLFQARRLVSKNKLT